MPEFRCLLIDRPGCGFSESHGRRFRDAADLAGFAEELVLDVFDGLELDRTVPLGTSFGGNLVLRASTTVGDRIDKLAALGWPVGAPIEHTPVSMRMASIPGIGSLFRSLLNHTDTMANELKQGPPIITPINGFNDSILIPDEVLASIAVPTYFLWGTNDPMGGEAIARPFAAKVPGSTLEMMPGGHAVWVDDPKRVAGSLAAFLEG